MSKFGNHRQKGRLRTRTQMVGRGLVTNATLLLLSLHLLSGGTCITMKFTYERPEAVYLKSLLLYERPRESQVGGPAGAAAPSPAPQTPPFYLGFATAAAQVLLVTRSLRHYMPGPTTRHLRLCSCPGTDRGRQCHGRQGAQHLGRVRRNPRQDVRGRDRSAVLKRLHLCHRHVAPHGHCICRRASMLRKVIQ